MRHEALLSQIERFCERTGMGETTLGRKAKTDPRIVHRLRSGCSLLLKTEERLQTFMRNYEKNALPTSNKRGK
ncbi:hypothetical protein [Aristophania vespae]|uniref:hypothetical protein n=1 Tax=Aristophania vespae TaxID=2697033 RepID=UPI0023512BA1|nr:hypothetical protein [Aristophania vespae]UMM63118.1 hypothetical protein DM15PD_00720 [Aristophania vespae]